MMLLTTQPESDMRYTAIRVIVLTCIKYFPPLVVGCPTRYCLPTQLRQRRHENNIHFTHVGVRMRKFNQRNVEYDTVH